MGNFLRVEWNPHVKFSSRLIFSEHARFISNNTKFSKYVIKNQTKKMNPFCFRTAAP